MADIKVFYLCDGKACGTAHECGECQHTSNIEHAMNFEKRKKGMYREKSPGESNKSHTTDTMELSELP